MLLKKASGRHDIAISAAAQEEHSEQYLLHPGFDATLDLTVFVSCYNEARLILDTLDTIRAALHQVDTSYEIIVIDDCSSDDSFELLLKYVDDHPEERLIVIRNAMNKGWAQNYIDAAFLGKGKYYKVSCGDNPEPRESIVEICRHIGAADMIIPNYNAIAGKSLGRRWLSKVFTTLVNLISGHRIKYYNGLAVHLRHNVMRWHPNTRGFGFQADIVCMLLDRGATYVEVSVPNIHRSGSRALTLKNVMSVGHTLLELLIRRVSNWLYGKAIGGHQSVYAAVCSLKIVALEGARGSAQTPDSHLSPETTEARPEPGFPRDGAAACETVQFARIPPRGLEKGRKTKQKMRKWRQHSAPYIAFSDRSAARHRRLAVPTRGCQADHPGPVKHRSRCLWARHGASAQPRRVSPTTGALPDRAR
jgi:hypothetical protein